MGFNNKSFFPVFTTLQNMIYTSIYLQVSIYDLQIHGIIMPFFVKRNVFMHELNLLNKNIEIINQKRKVYLRLSTVWRLQKFIYIYL